MLHNTEFLEQTVSASSSFRRRIHWRIHPEIDSTMKHQLISNSASQTYPDIISSASISSLKFFILEHWINKFKRKDKRNSHEFIREISSFYSGFFEKRHSKALLGKISFKLCTINSTSSSIYNTIYRPNIGTTDERILQLIIQNLKKKNVRIIYKVDSNFFFVLTWLSCPKPRLKLVCSMLSFIHPDGSV